jgi:hypothetical protein
MPAQISSCPTWVTGDAYDDPGLNSGSFSEDVVSSPSHLTQLGNRFGKVVLLRRMSPRSAVQSATSR